MAQPRRTSRAFALAGAPILASPAACRHAAEQEHETAAVERAVMRLTYTIDAGAIPTDQRADVLYRARRIVADRARAARLRARIGGKGATITLDLTTKDPSAATLMKDALRREGRLELSRVNDDDDVPGGADLADLADRHRIGW